MILGDELVSGERGQMIIGDSFVQSSKNGNPAFNYAYMGRAFQKPLGNSGDNISIDWGYAYVAATDMNFHLISLINSLWLILIWKIPMNQTS